MNERNQLSSVSTNELRQVSGGRDESPPPTKEPMNPDSHGAGGAGTGWWTWVVILGDGIAIRPGP